jgi:hypothetical protein
MVDRNFTIYASTKIYLLPPDGEFISTMTNSKVLALWSRYTRTSSVEVTTMSRTPKSTVDLAYIPQATVLIPKPDLD